MHSYNNILVIQTAFTGDAILGSSLLETLHAAYPQARISYLVRKGNDGLFAAHPFLHELLVWDKSEAKLKNTWRLTRLIRSRKFDLVINLQRFASSGFMAAFSGATAIRGFKKNPFSFLFTQTFPHQMEDGRHEIERNFDLIRDFGIPIKKPRLYPNQTQIERTKRKKPFICLAPASVWATKQWPKAYWVTLIQLLANETDILLVGGKTDWNLCEEIRKDAKVSGVENKAGEYNLLESTALFAQAMVTVSNDSGPVHMCSAVNAPIIEIYCSTVPLFGFSPLSDAHTVVETEEPLACRPCGLHGKTNCPLGHFTCGNAIQPQRVAELVRNYYSFSL